MDILTSVEPLIIPIAVVVCALLVYIFGFQKTQEPSFEHIAVLQTAKGRSNTTNRPRSTTPQVKANSAKTSNNKVANGHANVQASPKANGTVKPKAKEPSSNKENVRPQQQPKSAKKEKATQENVADLESGDWVLAPSRKAKAKKENVAPKTPEKTSSSSLRANNKNSIEQVSSNTPATTTTSTITQVEETQQQQQIEVEPKQAEVVKKVEQEEVVSSQPTSSPQQKAKENKKKSSPKVEKSTPTSTPPVKKEPKGEGKTVKEVRQQEQPKEAPSPVKETPASKTPASKNDEPKVVDPKNNIAFDEMGDTWEEAKSRGTRRRARKD